MIVAPDGKSSSTERNNPMIEPNGQMIADEMSIFLKSLKKIPEIAWGMVKYAIARIIPITLILNTIASATRHIRSVLNVFTGRLCVRAYSVSNAM